MGTVYFLRKKTGYWYLIKRSYIERKQKDSLFKYLGKKSTNYIKILSFLMGNLKEAKKPTVFFKKRGDYEQKEIEKGTGLSKSIVYKNLRKLMEGGIINYYYPPTNELLNAHSPQWFPKSLKFLSQGQKFAASKKNALIVYYFAPEEKKITLEEARRELKKKIENYWSQFESYPLEARSKMVKSISKSLKELKKDRRKTVKKTKEVKSRIQKVQNPVG